MEATWPGPEEGNAKDEGVREHQHQHTLPGAGKTLKGQGKGKAEADGNRPRPEEGGEGPKGGSAGTTKRSTHETGDEIGD